MLYEATFNPSENICYNTEAAKIAGKKLALYESGILDEGPFKGQTCYYIPNSQVGFIPQSDLTDIRSVSFVQWKETLKNLGY